MADRPVGRRRSPDGPGADDAGPEVASAGPGDRADDYINPGASQHGPHGPQPVGLDTGDPPGRTSRAEAWRKRSATGAILTGFALGLQQVFEPERKEPAIMMETSGEPPTDLPVEAELEMATSRRSVVKIRPWLLDEDLEAAQAGPDGQAPHSGIAPRARRPRRLRRRKR